MKKLFSLIVLSLLLASCGKEESSPKPQQVEELPQISIDKTPVPVTPPQPRIKNSDCRLPAGLSTPDKCGHLHRRGIQIFS